MDCRLSELLQATQQRLRDSELRVHSLEGEVSVADKKARDAQERCRQAEIETRRYAKNLRSLEQAYTALSKELVEARQTYKSQLDRAAAEVSGTKEQLRIQTDEMQRQSESADALLAKQKAVQGH
jgi:chromosome segregation ATPase